MNSRLKIQECMSLCVDDIGLPHQIVFSELWARVQSSMRREATNEDMAASINHRSQILPTKQVV